MNVYFTSDLHLQHNKIVEFGSRPFETLDEHDSGVIESVACLPTRSVVFVMGDFCFAKADHPVVAEWKACTRHIKDKRFIFGNHDEWRPELYMDLFGSVHGFLKYKEFWLSHAPIHPAELWGKINIHGHVHKRPHNHEDLQPPYKKGATHFNVNWDFWHRPVSLHEIREILL
jgi:calcineurin-like phosphoesterase family protein